MAFQSTFQPVGRQDTTQHYRGYSPIDTPFATRSDAIAQIFERCLRTKDPTSYLVPPKLGSSGFTFLCSMPSNQLSPMERIKEITPLYFVLKWEKESEAQNERFCSRLLRECNFNTSDMHFVSDSIAMSLLPYAIAKKPAMENLGNSRPLMLMPEFQASTFSALVKNGSLFQMDRDDWKKMFRFFGQVAVFDLLIGNDDRLIKLQGADDLSLEKNPSFNSGNIMLHLIPTTDSKKKLTHCYLIDNGTSRYLLPIKEPSVDDTFFALDALFDLQESTSSVAPLPLRENLPSKDLLLTEKIFKERTQKIHELFVFLMETPEILVARLALSIKNSIARDLLEKTLFFDKALHEISETLPAALHEGIALGKKQLVQNCSLIENLIDQEKSNHFLINLLRLIQDNLNYIKKFKE